MISPQPAAVRPHVIIPGAAGALLLEDEVLSRIDDERWGFVVLKGEPGSGKSAALAHLAHFFANDPRLRLADEPDQSEIQRLTALENQKLVVCVLRHVELPAENIEVWRLAGWSQDDWIEYLLAKHHDRCASVMRRVLDDDNRISLSGLPELWGIVLDRFANDETVQDTKSALGGEIDARLASSAAQSNACQYCFEASIKSLERSDKADRLWKLYEVAAEALPLLRHEIVQTLMAGKYLAERIRLGQLSLLERPLPEPLIRETAAYICEDRAVLDSLRQLLATRKWAAHATAASLLHAAGVSGRPLPSQKPLLMGAHLPGIQWQGLRVQLLDVEQADLTGADLSEARIGRMNASHAKLSGARLHGACVQELSARQARFDSADMSFMRAAGADFRKADLEHANFEGALLRAAVFTGANLSEARFCRADLTEIYLAGAIIDDADFTAANLASALLQGVALSRAKFIGAQFPHARLQDCDLENMRLPGSNFQAANLSGAHLTGSQMPQANFKRANLRNTGLAEIEWEGADLSYADLRGSTFHMGSSRSGLVGSPIASEGSRTGFYTDELNEQDFKAPEEIRKANLCGADLRGALLGNVDFYLVDLRGALFTPDQGEHFRRCGAILESRV